MVEIIFVEIANDGGLFFLDKTLPFSIKSLMDVSENKVILGNVIGSDLSL